GLPVIEPYDSLATLAGTGTIGLEILADAGDVTAVLAPLSGGGLMGGIAAAIKQRRHGVRVIGVEPEVAADAFESLRAGRIVTLPAEQMALTSADGLRARRLGDLTWPHVKTFVDDIVTVSEADIFAAMRAIFREARLVAEPSGAVAAAGAIKLGLAGAVAVVSGGNVDPAVFARVLRDG
ncbi:MAG: pyridoxal-phosphate dependent enzyme, partial [Caulobacteraceae bacterium]|nr:pyridoxal-phosphate dependent enzyme [Caulobacteraceae bacterium]